LEREDVGAARSVHVSEVVGQTSLRIAGPGLSAALINGLPNADVDLEYRGRVSGNGLGSSTIRHVPGSRFA
jgi:hypothetical protein